MSKKIKVAIDAEGRLLIDFSGFAGDACLKEAEALEAELRTLGIQVDLKKRDSKVALAADIHQTAAGKDRVKE